MEFCYYERSLPFPQKIDLAYAVNEVLKFADERRRNFVETIELQVSLKNYQPNRDKRFYGTVLVPHPCKKKLDFCVIGSDADCATARDMGVDFYDLAYLTSLRKDKKQVKKFCKCVCKIKFLKFTQFNDTAVHKYDQQYASMQMTRILPRILGPSMPKIGKYPSVLHHESDLQQNMDERYRKITFRLKKTLEQNVAVGTTELTNEQLQQNINTALEFLVSILKDGKANIKRIHIKSTMGPAVRFY